MLRCQRASTYWPESCLACVKPWVLFLSLSKNKETSNKAFHGFLTLMVRPDHQWTVSTFWPHIKQDYMSFFSIAWFIQESQRYTFQIALALTPNCVPYATLLTLLCCNGFIFMCMCVYVQLWRPLVLTIGNPVFCPQSFLKLDHRLGIRLTVEQCTIQFKSLYFEPCSMIVQVICPLGCHD